MEVFPSSFPSTEPSKCFDEPNWHFYNDTGHQLGCKDLIVNYTTGVDMCERFQDVDSDGKTVNTACCICGGGQHQSREPSFVPSVSQKPSSVPSLSSEPTMRPSFIPSSSPTVSTAPSDQPSYSNPSIFDGKPCIYHKDCLSFSEYNDDACEKDDEVSGVCKRGVSLIFQYGHREVTIKLCSFLIFI
jgi:hypothetical protein